MIIIKMLRSSTWASCWAKPRPAETKAQPKAVQMVEKKTTPKVEKKSAPKAKRAAKAKPPAPAKRPRRSPMACGCPPLRQISFPTRTRNACSVWLAAVRDRQGIDGHRTGTSGMDDPQRSLVRHPPGVGRKYRDGQSHSSEAVQSWMGSSGRSRQHPQPRPSTHRRGGVPHRRRNVTSSGANSFNNRHPQQNDTLASCRTDFQIRPRNMDGFGNPSYGILFLPNVTDSPTWPWNSAGQLRAEVVVARQLCYGLEKAEGKFIE